MKFYNFFTVSILYFVCFIQFSCKKDSSDPPIDNNIDLDGTLINDSSLLYPHKYLLSAITPSVDDLEKPVLITVHGFGSTNYEWTEFQEWSKDKTDFKVSLVLLGCHGRNYSDFKSSTWEKWQQPIIDEYNKLRNLGYKKINFIGSSTGCPLILNMITENKINPNVLKHVIFIDPIIVPSNKDITLIDGVGPILGYSKDETMAKGENGYWYKYRPQEALKELNKITQFERATTEDGRKLPVGVTLKVYKAINDASADPISAAMLKNGIKLYDGRDIEVIMVNTSVHVFTRLHGRDIITIADKNLQTKTFEEIHDYLF